MCADSHEMSALLVTFFVSTGLCALLCWSQVGFSVLFVSSCFRLLLMVAKFSIVSGWFRLFWVASVVAVLFEAEQHILGGASCLACPGCFSLFGMSEVVNVLKVVLGSSCCSA